MSGYRKPTYGAAVNMARLMYLLARERRPLPLEEILERLEISPRTARRYLQALNRGLTAEAGGPLIQVTREKGGEYWSLPGDEMLPASHYQLASLWIGGLLMPGLDGTVVRDGLQDVMNSLRESLGPRERPFLRHWNRKFHYTAWGMKRYERHDPALDGLLRALLAERKVNLTYRKPEGPPTRQLVRPYTLVFHRDALYLYAFNESAGECRLYAVDRIQRAEPGAERFEYPEDYDPRAVFAKSFGVFVGPGETEYEVEIEFDAELYDFVANRLWIAGQKTTPVRDGAFRMTAVVNSLFEIGHWLLSLGRGAQVLRPPELAAWVRGEQSLSKFVKS